MKYTFFLYHIVSHTQVGKLLNKLARSKVIDHSSLRQFSYNYCIFRILGYNAHYTVQLTEVLYIKFNKNKIRYDCNENKIVVNEKI